MDRETFKIISLAIELIECSAKAIDASRESVKACSIGGYSAMEWPGDWMLRTYCGRVRDF